MKNDHVLMILNFDMRITATFVGFDWLYSQKRCRRQREKFTISNASGKRFRVAPTEQRNGERIGQ